MTLFPPGGAGQALVSIVGALELVLEDVLKVIGMDRRMLDPAGAVELFEESEELGREGGGLELELADGLLGGLFEEITRTGGINDNGLLLPPPLPPPGALLVVVGVLVLPPPPVAFAAQLKLLNPPPLLPPPAPTGVAEAVAVEGRGKSE